MLFEQNIASNVTRKVREIPRSQNHVEPCRTTRNHEEPRGTTQNHTKQHKTTNNYLEPLLGI